MGVKCIDEKRIDKQKYKNLFFGYQVKSSFENDNNDE